MPRSTLRQPTASDMLVRGVILAFIGLILLIGPRFMGATALRELFLQASVVGWFALALGAAFIVRDGLRRMRGRKA